MFTAVRRGAALLPLLLLLLPPVLAPSPAAAQALRALDHDAYEAWRTIGARAISPNGAWVVYTLERENADGELVVREVDGDREVRIPRGASPTFTRDSRYALFTIRPDREAVRAARGNRGNNGDQPRDSLGILELAGGEVHKVPDVRTFRVPSEGGGWIAYHLDPRAGADDTTGAEGERARPPRNGTLVLRELATGEEVRFPHTSAFLFADDGARLVFTTAPPEDDGPSGVRTLRPGEVEPTIVMDAPGAYSSLAVGGGGSRIAFLHAPADPDAEDPTEPEADVDPDADPEPDADDAPEPPSSVYLWSEGDAAARAVATNGSAGIPDGWEISSNGGVSFSDNGERLYFGTVPAPPAKSEMSELEEEVGVEIWHWQDGELMTVQNVRASQERRRSFRAVLHIDAERIVQLADPELPMVTVAADGDGAFAIGRTGIPYGVEGSWESPNFSDTYLVDVASGERELILERSQGNPSFSPGGGYLTWYEPGDSAWYVREVRSGQTRSLSAGLPHPVHNELHDAPSPAGSYGSAGWIGDDRWLLLNDRHDVWAVDPSGREAPRNVTGGAGREADIRFRVIRLDREAETFEEDETVLLSAFSPNTKDAGFYRTSLRGSGAPERLVLEPRGFSTPVKATDADRLLLTQETYRDFPDLWVAGTDLADRRRVSDANPQQAEYRWGTAELVEWTSLDGIPLQGVLLKPDGFDPQQRYPMVVYFYERMSDGLHAHYAPVPHRSRINFSMYTSNDYLVFIPDIVYRVGYPGESAVNSVNPGILHLVDRGFVDPARIALQGHSWGGYQIAFMVTRSRDLYRAAAAGAPVANMTSAYGGIRRETGLVRQFQYERTQSRLGGSLWDMPMRYIENSPLFWVDKIETPLLIMHNDRDGHVPWEQGIELFVAMRRLGKPAWMVNYNDEPHWPTTFANRRDWNIRMKQFFDHFLKDAPPPVWLVEGIPAVRQGETLGYELVEGAVLVDGDR